MNVIDFRWFMNKISRSWYWISHLLMIFLVTIIAHQLCMSNRSRVYELCFHTILFQSVSFCYCAINFFLFSFEYFFCLNQSVSHPTPSQLEIKQLKANRIFSDRNKIHFETIFVDCRQLGAINVVKCIKIHKVNWNNYLRNIVSFR